MLGILAGLLLFLSSGAALPGGPGFAQAPSFQPILLAFDSSQDRLFAASASGGKRGSQLIVFNHPGRKGAGPGAALDLAGAISGLFYDAESKSLFASDAASHALLIFDRFDPATAERASRVLKRFNFPTGIYADRSGDRLFIADAHPGALLIFEKGREAAGERRPDRTIGPEKSGLNGPFSIAADPERGKLYVSNFDGVLVFNLADLAAPPERLPLPRGTLARGLAFDRRSKRLYIAAPMVGAYFVYDGAGLVQIGVGKAKGAFPFSIAVDPKEDRLYLAGVLPEIGIIEQASADLPERKERPIDRWIQWEGTSPPEEEPPPDPKGPTLIRFHP